MIPVSTFIHVFNPSGRRLSLRTSEAVAGGRNEGWSPRTAEEDVSGKTEGVYVVTDDGVYLESGTIVIDDDGDSTLESVGT